MIDALQSAGPAPETSEAGSEYHLGFLEQHFARYPDVPREVVIKTDLLRYGLWFTDAALAATAGSMVKSYRLFSYDFVPMESLARREPQRVPEHFIMLGGRYGLRPVLVQTSLAPDSPYVIDVVDGRLVLRCGVEILCEARFLIAPDYYSMKTADGTRYQEIIANGFFVTVFRNCQFWGRDEECGFCDINSNVRQMKRSREFTLNAPVKGLDAILEVARAIEREAYDKHGSSLPLSFLLSGGTIKKQLHGQTEDEFYGAYVEALKWDGPRRFINLQTNAKPKDVLRRYRAQGLDSHHADMEVWDRRLFEWICPGKAKRVGWDNWVRWLIDSVDVFGEGAVKPLFVCGVEMAQPHGFRSVAEAVASTTEGMDYLMSHGVIVRFNQWRRVPSTFLVREHPQPPVPLDFYIQLLGNRYGLWKKYGLPLPNQHQLVTVFRHLGVSHAAHEDYIHLMEHTYPPDIVELVDRASLPWESLAGSGA
ncbi:MAG: radical SAM protein [Gallionellaceae bacterium]